MLCIELIRIYLSLICAGGIICFSQGSDVVNILDKDNLVTWSIATLRGNYQTVVLTNKFKRFEVELLGVFDIRVLWL